MWWIPHSKGDPTPTTNLKICRITAKSRCYCALSVFTHTHIEMIEWSHNHNWIHFEIQSHYLDCIKSLLLCVFVHLKLHVAKCLTFNFTAVLREHQHRLVKMWENGLTYSFSVVQMATIPHTNTLQSFLNWKHLPAWTSLYSMALLWLIHSGKCAAEYQHNGEARCAHFKDSPSQKSDPGRCELCALRADGLSSGAREGSWRREGGGAVGLRQGFRLWLEDRMKGWEIGGKRITGAAGALWWLIFLFY